MIVYSSCIAASLHPCCDEHDEYMFELYRRSLAWRELTDLSQTFYEDSPSRRALSCVVQHQAAGRPSQHFDYIQCLDTEVVSHPEWGLVMKAEFRANFDVLQGIYVCGGTQGAWVEAQAELVPLAPTTRTAPPSGWSFLQPPHPMGTMKWSWCHSDEDRRPHFAVWLLGTLGGKDRAEWPSKVAYRASQMAAGPEREAFTKGL